VRKTTYLQCTSLLVVLFLSGCSLFGGSSKDKLDKIAVWEDQGWFANGELLKLMFDRDAAVRYRATLAVARVNDTLALDTVKQVMLNDSDPKVRAAAAFAIGSWTWHRGMKYLLEALGKETDPEALVAILEACGRCYTRDDYQKILPFLHHADPRVRTQAIETLDITVRYDVADSVLPLLDDSDPNVRHMAMFYLSHCHSDSAAKLCVSLLHDSSATVRSLAYQTIAKSKLPGARDTVLAGLGDISPLVRVGAADGLAAAPDTFFAPKLFPYLQTEKVPAVLEHLATAVGEHWRMKAKPYLEELLKNPDPGVRAAAIGALAKRLDFNYADAIAPAASDPTPLVQLALCDVVDKFKTYAPVDTGRILPLLRQLIADSVPRVRARAVQTYTSLGGANSDMYLNHLYNDPDPYARLMAVGLIGSYHVQDYLDSLRQYYDKIKNQWRPEMKWGVIAATANMAPSIHPKPLAREIFNLGMADSNRLVRWYTIAVWVKFREDHSKELGLYRTDLTPDNVGKLLHPYPGNPTAVIQTTKGPITIELRADIAPRTVRRFIQLARDHVYDNCQINDIQFGSIVQTGDRRGDGWGLPDQTVRDELSLERAEPGSVIWLITSRDSGHGAFSICLDRLPYLDWRYPIFARVTDGLDRAAALTYADSLRTVEIQTPGP
jgi:peptidylprolyl isomerase